MATNALEEFPCNICPELQQEYPNIYMYNNNYIHVYTMYTCTTITTYMYTQCIHIYTQTCTVVQLYITWITDKTNVELL